MVNFQKGDVVELKSGSPKMTVKGYKWENHKSRATDESKITCVWFDGNESKYDTFPEETLRKPSNSD